MAITQMLVMVNLALFWLFVLLVLSSRVDANGGELGVNKHKGCLDYSANRQTDYLHFVFQVVVTELFIQSFFLVTERFRDQ